MDRKAHPQKTRDGEAVRRWESFKHAAEPVLKVALIAAIERAWVHACLAPPVQALHVHPSHCSAAGAWAKQRAILSIPLGAVADATAWRLRLALLMRCGCGCRLGRAGFWHRGVRGVH
eukprot:scaffold3653_cov111-Isochrysis_galbana.AAC.4